MRKVTGVLLTALAAASGATHAQSSGEIVVRTMEPSRAQSSSTLSASCESLELKLVAPYGDSRGTGGVEPVTIFLNGRKIDLQQAGINERIGLANRLYKYTPLCSSTFKKMLIRYYSVHKEDGEVKFTVGEFSIFPDGNIIFEGEQTTDKDGFWFE